MVLSKVRLCLVAAAQSLVLMTYGGDVPNMDLLHHCYRARPAGLHRYFYFFFTFFIIYCLQ